MVDTISTNQVSQLAKPHLSNKRKHHSMHTPACKSRRTVVNTDAKTDARLAALSESDRNFVFLTTGISMYLETVCGHCGIAKECYTMLGRMYHIAKYSSSCHVSAVVIFSRFVASLQKQELEQIEWKQLLFTCVLIAQKFNDDVSLQNKEFKVLWARLRYPQTINLQQLELDILNGIDWKVSITVDIFQQCTDDLNALGKRCFTEGPMKVRVSTIDIRTCQHPNESKVGDVTPFAATVASLPTPVCVSACGA
jgi:hypothetical protein